MRSLREWLAAMTHAVIGGRPIGDDLTAVAEAAGVLRQPGMQPACEMTGARSMLMPDARMGLMVEAWGDEPCGARRGDAVCVAGVRHLVAAPDAHVWVPVDDHEGAP